MALDHNRKAFDNQLRFHINRVMANVQDAHMMNSTDQLFMKIGREYEYEGYNDRHQIVVNVPATGNYSDVVIFDLLQRNINETMEGLGQKSEKFTFVPHGVLTTIRPRKKDKNFVTVIFEIVIQKGMPIQKAYRHASF